MDANYFYEKYPVLNKDEWENILITKEMSAVDIHQILYQSDSLLDDSIFLYRQEMSKIEIVLIFLLSRGDIERMNLAFCYFCKGVSVCEEFYDGGREMLRTIAFYIARFGVRYEIAEEEYHNFRAVLIFKDIKMFKDKEELFFIDLFNKLHSGSYLKLN